METIIGVSDIVYPRPHGCTCPDWIWCCEPNPICEKFVPNERDDQCGECEHEAGCHGKA